jgi:phenylpropionate dioxygenase-like ring-hydroxylating dioxygenase large terminal subunit
MSNSLADDAAVIDRLLRHIDRQSTDLSEGVWHEPAENYRSPKRFDAEVRVMRRTRTPFCPSAALPQIGSYVARNAALTPIVAVRGQDSKVRAFRNACRHRGAQVVEGSGCKGALTCRYHAWTYGLDGQLRGVPHEHGFPGLDKSNHGLVPLTTVERGGLVFVTQEPGEAASGGDEVLPEFFDARWRLISTVETEFEMNWKIFVDGLLEGYHIRSTHAETFFPRQYDNITAVEYFGRNARVSYPYRNIERLRGMATHERKAAGVMTQVTHLFPNAAVATFPTHVTMVAVEPLTVASCKVVNYTLTDRNGEDTGALAKGRDFVTVGANEDREVGMAVQRGLATGANTVFTFGLFEGALRHFHRNLAAAVAD